MTERSKNADAKGRPAAVGSTARTADGPTLGNALITVTTGEDADGFRWTWIRILGVPVVTITRT